MTYQRRKLLVNSISAKCFSFELVPVMMLIYDKCRIYFDMAASEPTINVNNHSFTK